MVSTCRIALAAMLTVAACAVAVAQPVAQWTSTQHDFGLFHESEGEQSCRFVVTNAGDSALVLVRVQSSCGCTVVKFPTEPILPSDSAAIDVTYSPTGRPGPFEKTVWVHTNGSPRRTRLTIRGKVVGSSSSVGRYFPVAAGPLQFTSLTLAMREVKKGLIMNDAITAYNASNDTVAITFDNNTSHITCQAVPSTVALGSITTVSFFFDSSRTPVWGINDNYVTILATPLHSTASPTRIRANVVANVVEDFTALSDADRAKAPVCTIASDRVMVEANGAGEMPRGEFKLTNTGKSDLVIRRVMPGHRAVTAKSDKTRLKPGEEATVAIVVNPAKVEDKILNTSVTVITSDPYSSHKTVRVVGEIK